MGKPISPDNISVQGALQRDDYQKPQCYFNYQKWADNTYSAPILEPSGHSEPDRRCEPTHGQKSSEDLSPTGYGAIFPHNARLVAPAALPKIRDKSRVVISIQAKNKRMRLSAPEGTYEDSNFL